MPPVVHLEVVVVGPVVHPLLEETNSFAEARLHLVVVDDRVDGPDVLRVERESAQAHLFRAPVVARFLEPEGVHAEHGPVEGVVGRPGWQHLGDPVAERERVAREVVDVVPDEEREDIARVLARQLAEDPGSSDHVALDEGVDRGDVGALTR